MFLAVTHFAPIENHLRGTPIAPNHLVNNMGVLGEPARTNDLVISYTPLRPRYALAVVCDHPQRRQPLQSIEYL